MFAILYVITLVLPDPAPAIMRIAPSSVVTARYCSGFSLSLSSDSSDMWVLYN